jgi:hypothetical protein
MKQWSKTDAAVLALVTENPCMSDVRFWNLLHHIEDREARECIEAIRAHDRGELEGSQASQFTELIHAISAWRQANTGRRGVASELHSKEGMRATVDSGARVEGGPAIISLYQRGSTFAIYGRGKSEHLHFGPADPYLILQPENRLEDHGFALRQRCVSLYWFRFELSPSDCIGIASDRSFHGLGYLAGIDPAAARAWAEAANDMMREYHR